MQEMLLTLTSLEALSAAMAKAGLESTNLIFVFKLKEHGECRDLDDVLRLSFLSYPKIWKRTLSVLCKNPTNFNYYIIL
uniref:Uncharacterized protein n=1 Tax=Parascaris equorum TaxID=6256 RepID=A0A914S6A0_PAREQ